MTGIKSTIYQAMNDKKDELELWFEDKLSVSPKIITSSVDIRHSGFKIAPVDTNIFPAGFNLLNDEAKTKASNAFAKYMAREHANVRRILLIPEAHSRNKYYLDNVAALMKIVVDAGFEIKLGWPEEDAPESLESANGTILNPIRIDHDNIAEYGDLILINNDLSSGIEPWLRESSVPIIPPVGMGWYQRKKSHHFEVYQHIAREAAQILDIDPWLITPITTNCGMVNFKEKTGLECVALNIEKTLHRITSKYTEHNITDQPYVFIKADAGTYGLGIMTATSPDDIFEINKKIRNNMAKIRDGIGNKEVIIQEGIPTIDRHEDYPAEPMIYLVDNTPVSCLYRVNTEKNSTGNLNSRGMKFVEGLSDNEQDQNKCPVQHMIARLASLAAIYECYEDNWAI